jgi:FKBP-type peptidyl-prolyl cis-trans isomerase 2
MKPVYLWVVERLKQNQKDMESGDKINVQLEAKLSFGTRNNPVQTKTIDQVKMSGGTDHLDYFTFKGGKSEFRICGNEIYSITGPRRFYKLIKN